jgi:hypothetical protein
MGGFPLYPRGSAERWVAEPTEFAAVVNTVLLYNIDT